MKPTAESAITLCLLSVTYGQVMNLRGDLLMAAFAGVLSVVWAITAIYRTFRKD